MTLRQLAARNPTTFFVARRLAVSAPTILAVLTVIFFAMRTLPGDPAYAILGDIATAEAVEALREKLGLNLPVGQQYLDFITGILQGDLGQSLVFNRPVLGEIARVLPYTIELTIASILIGCVIGIPLGILSALYRNRMFDYITRVLSLVAMMTRATRSSMLEVLGEDYIRTARAKGAPRRIVVMRHALRNALIPVVTIVGLYFALIIGNSVLIETVFTRPGLGSLIIGSLDNRDYPMVQGLLVVYALIIVVVNLLTDLSYSLIDPRVKRS